MISKKLSNQFIIFLSISGLIWLFNTLSKEYRTTLSFQLEYVNIPQNQLLQNNDKNKLDVEVTASGFKILRTRIQKNTLSIDASNLFQDKFKRFYVLSNRQRQTIQGQLLSGVTIEGFNRDTIFVNIDVLASKKVPVKANTEINYHVGYGLMDAIELSPDSILISGSKAQLDTLSSLQLASLRLNDVKADFDVPVKVVLTNLEGLKLDTEEVRIRGKVDQFTEGTVKVPFTIVGAPSDLKLTTLSDTVEISFVVGLSDFNKIASSSFKVECDYNFSKQQNLSYLIPKIVQKPKMVKSYNILPQTIDFLIQK